MSERCSAWIGPTERLFQAPARRTARDEARGAPWRPGRGNPRTRFVWRVFPVLTPGGRTCTRRGPSADWSCPGVPRRPSAARRRAPAGSSSAAPNTAQKSARRKPCASSTSPRTNVRRTRNASATATCSALAAASSGASNCSTTAAVSSNRPCAMGQCQPKSAFSVEQEPRLRRMHEGLRQVVCRLVQSIPFILHQPHEGMTPGMREPGTVRPAEEQTPDQLRLRVVSSKNGRPAHAG
jgi:hypothetical protein